MIDHSILPPSSAHIWSKCTGWVQMSALYPELQESDAAREGTAAHEIAQMMLDNFTRGGILVAPDDGAEATNGVIFTDEMIDAAAMYAKDVRGVMVSSGVFGGPFLGIEKRLEMPRISDLMFGTSDAFLFDHKNATLYVWDFKFGFDPVGPFENLQLCSYVVGILDHLMKHTPIMSTAKVTVKMRIVQPRCYSSKGPIKEWTTDLMHVLNLAESRLKEPAHISVFEPDKARNVTGSHCKHCSARHACVAAFEAGSSLFEAATQVMPINISGDALGTQLSIIRRAMEQLKSLDTAYSEQVKSTLNSGARVRGFGMVGKMSAMKWNFGVDEVCQLGDLMGIDLSKKDVVTPRQAIKLGIDEAVINGYASRSRSSLELVEDDNNSALKLFGAILNEQ